MLLGMYALIKYVGKEIVNPMILAYLGFCGGEAVKPLLSTVYSVVRVQMHPHISYFNDTSFVTLHAALKILSSRFNAIF